VEKNQFQIPRVIYTSVPNLRRVDSRLLENWDFLKSNNPGWEHITFDDQSLRDFIRTNYSTEILRTYERIEISYGAARADYFRYLLLLKSGGVWLDAKTCIDKKLDEILRPDDEFLLTQWTVDQTSEANELFWGPRSRLPVSEFLTWCIFTKPNHLFMQKVVEDISRNINTYHPILHGIGGMGVLGTTGPLAYTRSIHPILEDAKWRRINLEEEKIRYTIFSEVFEHRDVIGTNYRKNYRPVIRRGLLVDWEVVPTLFVFALKKLLRRIRNIVS
jgi:hypothetical protein